MKRVKKSMLVSMLACMLLTLFNLLLTARVAEAAPLSCKTWNVASSPNLGSGDNFLTGVAHFKNNIWAVGDYFNSNGIDQTLTEFHC